jgi:F-type H+-transporting ATPase subunit k
MITLGTIGGLTSLSMGGSKAQKTQGPPLNAGSPDEESFIKYVCNTKLPKEMA